MHLVPASNDTRILRERFLVLGANSPTLRHQRFSRLTRLGPSDRKVVYILDDLVKQLSR